MTTRIAEPEVIRRIFRDATTWAVVGLSPRPHRTSHSIARFLQSLGYRIIPVNPEADEILGERSFPTLAAVPEPLDVVDIFRRSELAGAHVDEAIGVGAGAVWMQLGVVDAEAARRAVDAGLDVVMNTCPAIEYPRLMA